VRERRGRDTARSKRTYQIAAGDGEPATSSHATAALKQSITSPDATDPTSANFSQRSRRRSRSQLARSLGVLNGETLILRLVVRLGLLKYPEAKKTRLVLLVFAGMLGISCFGISREPNYAWLRQTFPYTIIARRTAGAVGSTSTHP